MDAGGLIRTAPLLVLYISVCVVGGNPIGSSDINCVQGSDGFVGSVDEGYTGDVEVLNGIVAGQGVTLEPFAIPTHLEYLDLRFTLGDTSATVFTKKPLDADAIKDTDSTLYYSVVCGSKIINRRTLKVNDLNNHSPVFEQKLYNTTVSEAEQLNTEVLQVTAKDADSSPANNQVTYSIRPASPDFSVTNSGAFILLRRLNYNVAREYRFVVTAKDGGGLNDTAAVTIYVQDFDNMNPYFSHSIYQASVHENQAGRLSAVEPEAIRAQDGDLGINMTLTYRISSVTPQKYQSNFLMDSDSGVVSVQTPLDREEMSSGVILVNIQAAQTDDSLKTAAAVVSVTVEDVNDNPPEFDRRQYSVTLPENSPANAVVFKAVITDRDQGGFMGSLRILSESTPFSIGPDGTVRVKNSSVLDRETKENFTFEIEAMETVPPNHAAVAQVTVTLLDENDNSPVFTSDTYAAQVNANQTEGMLLVQVRAEDEDVGLNGMIRYSIDFGNNDGYFSIDEDSGQVTLVKNIPLVENKILEFTLYITARDGGVISRSSTAQVNIRAPGNSKPQFLHKVYHGTVEEEQEAGVKVLKVDFLAIAPEVGVTLSVVTENDKFSISSSGEFTTKTKLDCDNGTSSYSVTISISDGVTSDTAVVEVGVTDINDNSPVFSLGSVTWSVPEDAAVGSNITAVTATDKDSGFNKEIRYYLRGTEGRFSADPVSGMVSVAAALDRESKAEYQLLVVAEDQGRPARSATASLLVRLTDVNDNFPKFSQSKYEVEVLETAPEDHILVTVSAVDPDDGPNGRVSYSLVQQSPPSDPPVFELDSSSGTLVVAQTLDFSLVNVYYVVVEAADGGAPSLAANTSVVVKVKDVNNNPPVFSQDRYDAAVPENLASGASILTLEVNDRDEGGFSRGSFMFTSDTFDINKHGVMTLKKNETLDRETKQTYMFQVVAVDQPTDGLSATSQVNITVLDYNDNSPQFAETPEPLTTPEGEYSEERPREIVTIVATDADVGLNGDVTVSLVSPQPLFRLTEGGKLLAVAPLDRETRDTYDLVLKASDKGSPQRESFTTVTVTVTDVNDNKPEFNSSSYATSLLLKDAAAGKLLLTLAATDRDAGDNAVISYSFSEGSSPYLALDGSTGAVTLTSNLTDVTEDTTLQLTATAEDHGRPPLSSTARVVVNLRVVSLVENVAFRSSTYNFSLPENQAAGAAVGNVWASAGSDVYTVTYAVKTHADLFSIGAGGAIVTKATLDRENQEWYVLEVEAVDSRDPPTSATAMVRVQVDDVNEAPQFPAEIYRETVFSIAPYKTPVTIVKASDPDLGESALLVYSVSSDRPQFDVERSSGLVFVVSALDLAGQTVSVQVTAADPRGLKATTTVEVEVRGSASSSDVVVMSLNQPANMVEMKITQLETSLGSVLGWTVDILDVSSAGASESRNAAINTLVSFIALDGEKVVSSEDVRKKLQSQSAVVRAELSKVFGDDLQFNVQTQPQPQDAASNRAAVIALGVLLALSIMGLIVSAVFIVRFKTSQKHDDDSDKESFDIGRNHERITNSSTPVQTRRREDDETMKTNDADDDTIADANDTDANDTDANDTDVNDTRPDEDDRL